MEANNMAAMRAALRAALEKVDEIYDILSKPCIVAEEARQACREARGLLIPALDKPPRQCDVGTAEEQAERKMEFCYKQGGCGNCSFNKSATLTQCAFAWAQTPYEEGGAQ